MPKSKLWSYLEPLVSKQKQPEPLPEHAMAGSFPASCVRAATLRMAMAEDCISFRLRSIPYMCNASLRSFGLFRPLMDMFDVRRVIPLSRTPMDMFDARQLCKHGTCYDHLSSCYVHGSSLKKATHKLITEHKFVVLRRRLRGGSGEGRAVSGSICSRCAPGRLRV